MAIPRPKKLYAVVGEKRPHITYQDLFQDTDVVLAKGEQLWEVEVRAIRKVHKKRAKTKRSR